MESMNKKEIKRFIKRKIIENKYNSVFYTLESIIRDAESLTTGNISHHRCSIKRYAESITKILNEIKNYQMKHGDLFIKEKEGQENK
jgi:hypothetical protein